MTRRVWACEVCGDEVERGTEVCPRDGGAIERVDPLLVNLADGLDVLTEHALARSVDERILRKLLALDYEHEAHAPFAELKPGGDLIVDGWVDLTEDESARVAKLLATKTDR